MQGTQNSSQKHI